MYVCTGRSLTHTQWNQENGFPHEVQGGKNEPLRQKTNLLTDFFFTVCKNVKSTFYVFQLFAMVNIQVDLFRFNLLI